MKIVKITVFTIVISFITNTLSFGETTIVVNGKTIRTSGSGETTIVVNGQTIRTFGKVITIENGTSIVDGRVLSENAVQGSGEFAVENRDLPNFTELYLGIAADVTIISGQKSKCQISADDNLLPLILTECTGGALRISAKDNYSSARKIAIKVETPLLTRAENNGSGNIDLAEVTRDKIELVINGSGGITANGKVVELNATINGSGSVQAANLQADIVKIGIQGSGNVDVNSIDALTAEINGSGNIKYIGTPSKLNTRVRGSGTIVNQ